MSTIEKNKQNMEATGQKQPLLQVGHILTVAKRFSPTLAKGYVYEVYQIGDHRGISILLADGHDLGGFSPQDQQEYLSYEHDSGFIYRYEGALKFYQDIKAGVFSKAFNVEQS